MAVTPSIMIVAVLLAAAAGVVLVVVAIVALALSSSGRRQVAPAGGTPVPRDPSAAYLRARRHAAMSAGAAWIGAFVLAVPLVALVGHQGRFAASAPGIGVALVPTIVGLTLLAIAAVGEMTWPRPEGSVRSAALTPRTVATIAPRALRRTVWALATSLVVVLVLTGLTAETDGRSVGRDWVRDEVVGSSSAGPYPGWPYAVPLIVAAFVTLAAAEGVLRLVARRPAVADTAAEDDERLRRVSARRALAAAQLVLAGTLGGVLVVSGAALRNASSLHTSWSDATTSVDSTLVDTGMLTVGTASLVAGLLVLVGGLVATVAELARATAEANRQASGAPSGEPDGSVAP